MLGSIVLSLHITITKIENSWVFKNSPLIAVWVLVFSMSLRLQHWNSLRLMFSFSAITSNNRETYISTKI